MTPSGWFQLDSTFVRGQKRDAEDWLENGRVCLPTRANRPKAAEITKINVCFGRSTTYDLLYDTGLENEIKALQLGGNCVAMVKGAEKLSSVKTGDFNF